MSVFIKKSCCSDRLLERIMDALADLMNLTRMDLAWSTLLHLARVFEFPQTEVVSDELGLNRAVCINTGDDSHYVL